MVNNRCKPARLFLNMREEFSSMNDWIIYGAYYIYNFFSYILKLLEDCFEK